MGSVDSSKDESRHSNDTKEDESKDKTKEDNTSTLKDYESDVENAKPKAKDNPKNIETKSNDEDKTNEKENTKTNENEQKEVETNDEESTKLKDCIPLEETGTIKLNDTKTKPDDTIPKEIDTESLSSCDTEETSTITLNTEQLKKKRKKKPELLN